MFRRFFHSRRFVPGTALLVLLASLPEVVCCCDISWGPAGLLGQAACCEQQESPSASCCCCKPACEPAESTGLLTGGSKDCACRLSYLTPSPMNGSPAVAVEFDLAWTPLDFICLPTTGDSLHGSRQHEEQHPPPLTSLSRCALLQTWLA
jgi:hypothetical protein